MGNKAVSALEQVLLKNQAAFGTVEAALVAADVAEVESPSVEIEPRVKDIDLVGAGFTQNQSIIGPREASVSMTYHMRTGAAEASPGQIIKALKSCGFKSTESDTDADEPASVDRYILTPSNLHSEWIDSTVWHHSGCLDTSLSLITKIQNVLFNGKIALDFDNASATLAVDGKGVLTAEPALGTQATVTPSAVVTPALIATTLSFFSDTDYVPISMEFDFGQEITVSLNPATVAHGLGVSLITKRKMKWSAKVYHDTGALPNTPLFAGTLGGISVAWGTAPNKFTVSTTKAQITSMKKSEQNGITTYDLSGILVDNNLAIQIDCVVA
jgi:hypothetical protein